MSTVNIDSTTGLRVGVVPQPFPVGPQSIFDALDACRGKTLLVDGTQRLSGAEVLDASAAAAGALTERGVTAGDRVGWETASGIDAFIGFVASVRCGALWAGLDHRATDRERDRLCSLIQPAAVLDRVPAAYRSPAPPPPDDTSVAAAIGFTSGTSGLAKPVAHSHHQLLYPGAVTLASEGRDHAATTMVAMPWTTLNMLALGPLTAAVVGGIAVSHRWRDAARFVAAVHDNEVTRALIVPTMARDLAAYGADFAASSLRTLIVGGSGLRTDEAEQIQRRLGVPVILSYGFTEAPTGVARRTLEQPGATPLPGVQIQIDASDQVLVQGSRTGPWAGVWTGMLGYWGQPAKTAAAWANGWLQTADRGAISDTNLLTIAGRMSDLIDRGGALIDPSEIERCLLTHPDVEAVAVLGLPDERLGQQVAAAVVGDADFGALRELVRAHLSAHKIPSRWLTVSRLPYTVSGKVDRRSLRQSFATV